MNKQEILEIVYRYADEHLNKKIFVPGVSPVPASGAVIYPEDVAEVADALLEFWYTDWKKCAEFKRRLCAVTDKKHCVLVNSGSSASLIAQTAIMKRTKEKYVVTTALGFPTTVYPIWQNGKVPIFIDTNPKTLSPEFDQFKTIHRFNDTYGYQIFTHALGFPFDERYVSDVPFIADCCFPAESLVKTKRGDIPIECVTVNDFVLTRYGYQKVLVSEKTGIKQVINKYGIVATPNHPIITTNCVKPLDTLSASDIIFIWNQQKFCIEEKSIKEIQNQNIDNIKFIIGHLVLEELHFIGKFGKIILEQFQKIILFITKMEIHSIMMFPILKFYPNQNIQNSIGMKVTMIDWMSAIKISNMQGLKHQNGTKAKPEKNYIEKLEKKVGKIEQCTKRFVKFAGIYIKPIFRRALCFVQKNVNSEVEVYNIKVENHPEFFVNNVLVHNCDALRAELYYPDAPYPVGGFADAMTLSFFPAHHITTGEGGAILTNDEELAKEMECLINWGRDCYCLPGQANTCGHRFEIEKLSINDMPSGWDHKYTFTKLGYNLKMTEFQAALGLSQITHLDDFVQARIDNSFVLRANLGRYKEFLNFISVPEWSKPSPFGFPIMVKRSAPFTAQELIAYLEKHKISTRRFFGGNLTRQPFIKDLSYTNLDLSGTDYIMECGFWIGCHVQLTRPHLDYVIDIFGDFFKEKGLI